MEEEIKIEVVECGSKARIFLCRLNPRISSHPLVADIQTPSAYAKHRKTEWLTIRYLVAQAGFNHEIQYSEKGKPYLKDAAVNISISHSCEYAAVMVAPGCCGMDVEMISGRAARVAHKFLSVEERNELAGENQNLLYTLFWSAKESLYKITGSPDFLKSFRIVSQSSGEQLLWVEHREEKNVTRYKVFYTIFDGHVLTWIHEG